MEEPLQVLSVVSEEIASVPGQVPEARVHNHQVRGILAPSQLLQDVLNIRRVNTREEIEAHQVAPGAELTHLAIVGAIVHASPSAALQQYVVLEAQLTLALQLTGRQQAVLLEQEHQVLVDGSLDRVAQDDDELVVQQLLDFVSSEMGHDGFLLGRLGGKSPRGSGEPHGEELAAAAFGLGGDRQQQACVVRSRLIRFTSAPTA